MLRDRIRARLATMGDAPDYTRVAAEILGIRNAPPEFARCLISQALVMEDPRDRWREVGERLCAAAPPTPGVYIRDAGGRAVYVGKAINLRRRLRAHFAERRWRALNPHFATIVGAEWQEVGSELEALLREAALIETSCRRSSTSKPPNHRSKHGRFRSRWFATRWSSWPRSNRIRPSSSRHAREGSG